MPVHSCEQVLDLMRRGYETRTTFATNSNEHSSRSHCILSVHVLARNKHTNMVARGKLHLVDLAGSERVGKSGATGARLKEAQAINKCVVGVLAEPVRVCVCSRAALLAVTWLCPQVAVRARQRYRVACGEEQPHAFPRLYPHLPLGGFAM